MKASSPPAHTSHSQGIDTPETGGGFQTPQDMTDEQASDCESHNRGTISREDFSRVPRVQSPFFQANHSAETGEKEGSSRLSNSPLIDPTRSSEPLHFQIRAIEGGKIEIGVFSHFTPQEALSIADGLNLIAKGIQASGEQESSPTRKAVRRG